MMNKLDRLSDKEFAELLNDIRTFLSNKIPNVSGKAATKIFEINVSLDNIIFKDFNHTPKLGGKSEIQQAIDERDELKEKAEKWDWYESGRKDKAHAQGLEDCTGYAYDKVKELQQQIKELKEKAEELPQTRRYIKDSPLERIPHTIEELQSTYNSQKQQIKQLRQANIEIIEHDEDVQRENQQLKEKAEIYDEICGSPKQLFDYLKKLTDERNEIKSFYEDLLDQWKEQTKNYAKLKEKLEKSCKW